MIDYNFMENFNRVNIKNKKLDFFDIISPREVMISEWLAFLFDSSRNGVGNKIIDKLLEAIDESRNIDELEFISTSTEVSTDKSQRMDIVIKYNGLWIIIENKIDSHENGNQTEEYYNYIESIKGNNEVVYIYLKPNYNSSVPKESHFKILTYDNLINKLKEISEFDYREKDKYKYLKEFLVSGDRFMKNEELDFNEEVQFYMNNYEKMNAIEEEYKIQNRRLHNKLRYDLLNYLNETRSNYLTDDDKGTSPRTYIQYFKNNWKNEKHVGAHFELLFNTDKLLVNKIDISVVLHLEGDLNDYDLDKFKEKGITKNKSLAFDNNKGKPISYLVECNFSSLNDYNKSLNNIKTMLDKIINEYEHVVEEVFR